MEQCLSRNEVNAIFEIFHSINPTPKIELNYTNNFTLLIAVILSAQSTDKMVNQVTPPLFEFYDTPSKMLTLTFADLRDKIKKIGLSSSKAKNILAACEILNEKFSGNVPSTFSELITLPGVGRKTADVVLNSAFDFPTIAVDRHIFRIAHRIGITRSKDTDEVANNLLKVIPEKWHKYAHHWLVLHGRYICKALKPLCQICPISQHCQYYRRTK